MHRLPGDCNEFELLHEKLLKVLLFIMLMKDLTDKYFHEGFRYREIIALLKNRRGINVSLCALQLSMS